MFLSPCMRAGERGEGRSGERQWWHGHRNVGGQTAPGTFGGEMGRRACSRQVAAFLTVVGQPFE